MKRVRNQSVLLGIFPFKIQNDILRVGGKFRNFLPAYVIATPPVLDHRRSFRILIENPAPLKNNCVGVQKKTKI